MRSPLRLSSRSAVGRRAVTQTAQRTRPGFQTSLLQSLFSPEKEAWIAVARSISALRRIGMTPGASLATQFHDGPLDRYLGFYPAHARARQPLQPMAAAALFRLNFVR